MTTLIDEKYLKLQETLLNEFIKLLPEKHWNMFALYWIHHHAVHFRECCEWIDQHNTDGITND